MADTRVDHSDPLPAVRGTLTRFRIGTVRQVSVHCADQTASTEGNVQLPSMISLRGRYMRTT